ncbi:MAG: response regulator [Candidatus Omnitrophica bacterium]|nr:response regulator [Candidatus Omnitrophota bacterium]
MIHLLVVDDEIEVCDFLTNYFSDKGYMVSSATSGEEALHRSRATHPDLVLLDVRMPGISGLEVLHRLRKEENPSKVVMITAIEDPQVIEEAKRLGAEDYIVKPFDLDYLDKVVLRKITTLLHE